MAEALKQLIARLETIAKLNKDDFSYSIGIIAKNPMEFRFLCKDSAKAHIMLDGWGLTIEAACIEAEDQIEGMCEDWGYELPKKG